METVLRVETVAVNLGVDFQGRDTARRVSLPLNRRRAFHVGNRREMQCRAVESFHLRKSSKELLK